MSTAVSHLGSVISGTKDAVDADSKNAHAVFRATATAHDAVASTIGIGKFSVEVDEPPALGGENTAPNPVEFYLASLLSCQVVTYRVWADKLGIVVDDIKARAEGDLDVRGFFGFDESVRAGFGEVRVVVKVTGPETREKYVELHEAVDAHCPVLDLTRNQTPVHTTLETD
ncbi:OsmC family protein [Rhodococcus sp. G-MC3]|uniref:OsmC family protein n=1 Tax=Rhodococcus sp. G-MC3 TaxID=3046209 RepID=UPI0024BBA460|nr:OsmC family protein [Rhodococcus sp. G-MC3]MDJ0392318.1 OsmC family protein [Rhodococcus sp. G-MC3]